MTTKQKAEAVINLNLDPKNYGLEEFPSLEEKECILVCPYCKQTFILRTHTFYNRLFTKKFLKNILVCFSLECKRKLKQEVIKEQTRLGQTSAKGHKPSKDQIRKWQETLKRNGSYDKIVSLCNSRKGKTFEELYGVEKAEQIRNKIKQNTPNIQIDYKGKRAREGCSFSENSKKQISESLKNFYKTEQGRLAKVKIAKRNKRAWEIKSDEEKLAIIKKELEGQQKVFEKNSHAGWGYFQAWYESTPTQPFRSSWERKYFEYLNKNKIYYKSNKSLYIKYLHPDGTNHFYIPDVLIFEDSEFKNLKEIQEIKPFDLVDRPVNQAKCKAAKKLCEEKGITFRIITELELKEWGIDL